MSTNSDLTIEMVVPILEQGDILIASVQASLTDTDLLSLRDRIVSKVQALRSHGVIIDVTGLDVLDSYAIHTLTAMAKMLDLCGARTVIVGIRPDVAFAMVQLGLTLGHIQTALNLDEGLEALRNKRAVPRVRQRVGN